MNAVIIGIVISAILMAIVLRVTLKRDRMLFSSRHLIDAAIGVSQVRRAALENIEAADKARSMRADDPRSWVTPKKVVLVHRIAKDGNKFVHTCSVSLRGGKTPEAVGSVFMALFVHLFGLSPKGLEVHVTPKGRYHLGFTLNEAQQKDFESKKVELPGMDAAAGLRTKLVVLAKQMRFKNVYPRG